jgi:hypothetical protein
VSDSVTKLKAWWSSDGAHWHLLTVTHSSAGWSVTVPNPASRTVSLRAQVTGSHGDTSTETVYPEAVFGIGFVAGRLRLAERSTDRGPGIGRQRHATPTRRPATGGRLRGRSARRGPSGGPDAPSLPCRTLPQSPAKPGI